MAAQDLQFISDALEKAPFNKKVSILDLDALNGPSALQFLNDVFASLDSAHAGNISDEEPQETALRFFMFLRLVRYPSPDDPDELSTWRQDVAEGKRRAIASVLVWILRNVQMVQQRVYLAKYMIKIDVPPELRADPEINQICEEQDRLVAEFATVHKTAVQLKADADTVNEYRQEIKDLRLQKSQTEARVAELLTRIRGMPGKSGEKEERMAVAHQLRLERDKCSKLADKRTELLQLAPTQTDRIVRLKDYTTRMTNDWLEMTPEKLLKKLEDRLVIQRRAVTEVVPKAIADERAIVAELRNLIGVPDFTDKSLNELRIKAQMLQTEVFNMSEKLRAAIQGPEQAQAAIHRGQLEAATSKKRDLTVRNDTMHRDIRELEKQLRQAKGMESDDGESLSVKLMQSSEDFEKKQQTIKQLQAERGNMVRSNAILTAEIDRISHVLAEWEKRTGISPHQIAEKSLIAAGSLKENANVPVATLAENVRQLEKKSATKRTQVAELLTELQPIRQRHKTQQDVLAQERTKLGLSGGESSDAEEAMKKLHTEISDLEGQIVVAQTELEYAGVLEKRAEEAKQTGNNFLTSIQADLKRETARLPQLRSSVDEANANRSKHSGQAIAWRDLNSLFDMKVQHLQEDLESAELKAQRITSESGRERIVMGY